MLDFGYNFKCMGSYASSKTCQSVDSELISIHLWLIMEGNQIGEVFVYLGQYLMVLVLYVCMQH